MSFLHDPVVIVVVLVAALLVGIGWFVCRRIDWSPREPDNRLTDRARVVVDLAVREASHMEASGVGVEHVLVGLAGEGRGVAAHVLKNNSVGLRELREVVRRSSAESRQFLGIDEVIELAARQADSLSHAYIGTEHLLLAVLSSGPATATVEQILKLFSVAPESLREEVLGLLGLEFPDALGMVEIESD